MRCTFHAQNVDSNSCLDAGHPGGLLGWIVCKVRRLRHCLKKENQPQRLLFEVDRTRQRLMNVELSVTPRHGLCLPVVYHQGRVPGRPSCRAVSCQRAVCESSELSWRRGGDYQLAVASLPVALMNSIRRASLTVERSCL